MLGLLLLSSALFRGEPPFLTIADTGSGGSSPWVAVDETGGKLSLLPADSPERGHDLELFTRIMPLSGTPGDHRPAGVSRISPQIAHLFFQPIAINRADRQELMLLDGIGAALADRIIRARTAGGRIAGWEQLLALNGISRKKIARLQETASLD